MLMKMADISNSEDLLCGSDAQLANLSAAVAGASAAEGTNLAIVSAQAGNSSGEEDDNVVAEQEGRGKPTAGGKDKKSARKSSSATAKSSASVHLAPPISGTHTIPKVVLPDGNGPTSASPETLARLAATGIGKDNPMLPLLLMFQ